MQRIAASCAVALVLTCVTTSVSAQNQQGRPPAPGSGSTASPSRPGTQNPPAAQRPAAPTSGQPAAPPAGAAPSGATSPDMTPPAGIAPTNYIIGPDDVLTVVFWRDKDLTGDVTVRPDGMITVPLINEVMAAGRTPDQLRRVLQEMAAKYIEDPNAAVVVKEINSRKVYITGMVNKIGAYTITAPTTVLQLITMAGGLQDFADEENIVVVRTENGKQTSYQFNYKDVVKRRRLQQNIFLQPGDTVVVP
jgi:polysaccharide export outer membrane protein